MTPYYTIKLKKTPILSLSLSLSVSLSLFLSLPLFLSPRCHAASFTARSAPLHSELLRHLRPLQCCDPRLRGDTREVSVVDAGCRRIRRANAPPPHPSTVAFFVCVSVCLSVSLSLLRVSSLATSLGWRFQIEFHRACVSDRVTDKIGARGRGTTAREVVVRPLCGRRILKEIYIWQCANSRGTEV